MTDSGNNDILRNVRVTASKDCPYLEKCYRRNPIHFSEMSHPHLEKLVEGQLDGVIEIPESLSFPCTDRDLLADQLKILQFILRKRRGESGESTSTASTSTSSTVDADLKAKVERNKQASLNRRQQKLKVLDEQAIAITKNFTSDVQTDRSNGAGSVDMPEIEIIDVDPPDDRKRTCPSSSNLKRSRETTDSEEPNNSKKSNTHSESSSSRSMSKELASQGKGQSGQSLFESYSTCRDGKAREQVRKRAIEMMKRQGHNVSVVESGNFALKYALSTPYNLFFTRVEKITKTHQQQYSITFPEILDTSLGEITSSLQMTFMVDLGWLCLQYLLAAQNPTMTVLYGDRVDTEKVPPNITLVPITMNNAFGCHHSKIMILKYKDDGIRIVISTGNLYSDDWESRTQGIWISPHLPRLPKSANTADGESPTGFRKDFERYLTRYQNPNLAEWLAYVRVADFSAVNVAFVSSIPGNHKLADQDLWGHLRLGSILTKNATLPPDAPQWPIIAQSSSIGSLGPNYESWVLKDIVTSMSRETNQGLKSQPNFKFIYPSLQNYKDSIDCRNGSCCLPYSMKTHSKQMWLESYLYQWKATRTCRDRAMPHIKSYTRISPDLKRIPWFVLTSANLSKAAWGKKTAANYILNYEAGIVFLPKFITSSTTFPIAEEEPGIPVFPIPYDLPLTVYKSNDKPFVSEHLSGA